MVFSNVVLSQDLTLHITSKNDTENNFLKQISFTKTHPSEKSIKKEIQLISEHLKKNGYFLNSLDSIVKKQHNHTYYYSLGKRINTAAIKFNNKLEFISTDKLSTHIATIIKKLDKEGKSFSTVKLKNIEIKNDTLFTELNIKQSKKRKIDKVIITGYEDFSKAFLKHYLKINRTSTFNKEKLISFSRKLKSLNFINEIKPPEVLFLKDSTFLYLYLKKRKNNSFDGLVNFASKENGGVLFNGYLDLKLNNIFNSGEQFKLFWNNIAEESQEFNISTTLPYIFNSVITPQLSFKLYKQDSAFINSKLKTSLNYNLNEKTTIGLTYDSENSENLIKSNINNIKSFNASFWGIQFNYSIIKNDLFNNSKFNLTIKTSFGNRKSENKNSKQIKITSNISYLFEINQRNYFYASNSTGHINSDLFLDNELFRIGGANSIKGFNEQSIFTSFYTYFNFEYRFLLSNSSYIHTITDFGKIKNTSLIFNNLLGFGAGYLTTLNNSTINISYVLGKTTNSSIKLNNSKIIVKWTLLF
ncbi:hypothetical protein OD91_2285 [Lutibacter sp. Hel_I_33_5]|uniref:ShlB/FhaC/HecB family hemolysin secretion/activation protein n=1 Tax=Lutibacter sp. Hel_I_33_5 TaxID=1566289 RepID=UPI0011A0DA8D|nr:ShlB/FhaC/HecB family hemolysin secretion/activation protein [Lutibacter sp. Hel_I_33_5]TVZ56981.1 hypothetical protein OD91_2285 [Lutibacter sp. Hel_I_33_5]